MKTDKKIEEIIDKKFETCWVDKRSAIAHVHKGRLEELKSELNTEVQKAVEDAVRGFYEDYISNVSSKQALLDNFVEYVYGRKAHRREIFPAMLVGWWHEQVKRYLQSLDKGDKE